MPAASDAREVTKWNRRHRHTPAASDCAILASRQAVHGRAGEVSLQSAQQPAVASPRSVGFRSVALSAAPRSQQLHAPRLDAHADCPLTCRSRPRTMGCAPWLTRHDRGTTRGRSYDLSKRGRVWRRSPRYAHEQRWRPSKTEPAPVRQPPPRWPQKVFCCSPHPPFSSSEAMAPPRTRPPSWGFWPRSPIPSACAASAASPQSARGLAIALGRRGDRRIAPIAAARAAGGGAGSSELRIAAPLAAGVATPAHRRRGPASHRAPMESRGHAVRHKRRHHRAVHLTCASIHHHLQSAIFCLTICQVGMQHNYSG